MTTVRHVSQCSTLRYSFSFSHKCPGLVGASSRLQSDALCANAHHHADYSSAQWAVTTLVRYATRTVLTESCVSTGHQGSNSFKQYPITLNAYVCSCSTPSFSSPSFSSPANSSPANSAISSMFGRRAFFVAGPMNGPELATGKFS